MIVSWNWLQEYTQINHTLDQVTHNLTMSGLNLEGVEQIDEDWAIDLEVTSNRPDCLGHIGVAREISVLFDTPLSIPDATIQEDSLPTSDSIRVSNEVPDHCSHYMARVIRDVKVGPSPDWLVKRLESLGLRSVNNIVDVTNYVLMECGQPLHAFDLDQLQGSEIVVRMATKDETIQAIDGRDYRLTPEMCVIADASKPVAIAGVMGGQMTEVSETTTNLLIETAAFAPLSVRKTTRTLSLFSDSSYRFERGVNLQNLDWANRRCSELIVHLAGGQISADPIISDEVPTEDPDPIQLRFPQLDRLLGIHIPPQRASEILINLGLREVSADDHSGMFVAPSWRPDLTREVDLIEEVARIYGYDQISEQAPPPVFIARKSDENRVMEIVQEVFTAAGFHEAMTLAFVSDQASQTFNPRKIEAPLAVEHSSRKMENVLRHSLVPSLLQSRRHNERNGNFQAELFETARIFTRLSSEGAEQTLVASCISIRSFHEIKGIVNRLIHEVNHHLQPEYLPAEIAEFQAGRGAELKINGEFMGWIGELSSSIRDQFDLQQDITVAEIDLELLSQQIQRVPQLLPLPEYPAINRDFNFVMPETITWNNLADSIEEAAGPLFESIQFGGQYRGKQLGAGLKSYVAQVTFRSLERTLTNEEVDEAQASIIQKCESELDVKLRG